MGLNRPAIAYIGLGANLGDRWAAVSAAIEHLDCVRRTRVDRAGVSSFHETQPWDVPELQPMYVNAVVRVVTRLDPHTLLEAMHSIEQLLGRQRAHRNAARTIDLDLLLYDDWVIDSESLTLPHPRMHERRFVLEPLGEIAGDPRHPRLGRRVSELAAALMSTDRAHVNAARTTRTAREALSSSRAALIESSAVDS